MAQQGRRRRKRRPDYTPPPRRGEAAATEASADRSPRPPEPARRRRRSAREKPPAPWGSFPLVELVVLCSIVLVVVGFFVQGTRGGTMIVAGLALGSLAGLELSVREHFAGYKSHTIVLAGAATVLVIGLGFFLLPSGWPQRIALLAAALVFSAAFYLLREAFKRRSGGIGFR